LDSGYFWAQGLKCVQEDPWVLLSSTRYIFYLFFGNQLWPSNVTEFRRANYAYALFYGYILLPMMLVAFILLWKHPSKQRVVLIFVFSAVAMAWFFFGEMRYRIPFDVVFLPMASYGFSSGYRKMKWSSAFSGKLSPSIATY